MWKQTRQVGLAALVAGAFLGSSDAVQAQFNFNANMNPSFVSGMTQAQYTAFLQQAAAAKAAVQGTALFPAGTGFAAANPYSPVTASPYSSAVNPYNPVGSPYSSGYDSGWNPYMSPWGSNFGTGAILQGQADVMRAFGTVITSQEQARIMREQALQARLETKKKRFDLEMYIKANTPTFTEEQIKVAKMTLKRIQNGSTEAEVVSGKALNFLLADLARHPGKRASIEPLALNEEMLRHLNLSRGNVSLGVLRNGGQFTWPVVFQEYFPADQLRLIENQAKILVKSADQGKLDVNVLKDMRNEIDKLSDQVRKKVDDIPTTQLLDAKRFLGDLDAARLALERGEAMTQVNFQKWAAGGRNLQQLVDYMITGGLVFAGSTQGDEFAYRAVYSGMVALDVALNAQTTGSLLTEEGQPKENQ